MRAHFAPNATIAAVMTVSFALFDTAAGRCAIAWGARGIIGIQLPEANEQKTRGRVLQRFLDGAGGGASAHGSAGAGRDRRLFARDTR